MTMKTCYVSILWRFRLKIERKGNEKELWVHSFDFNLVIRKQ